MHIDLDRPASRALFTLPTGIEAATDRSGLKTVASAKQASVLFDEVVVETGMRVVELSSTRVLAVIERHAANLSPTLLSNARKLTKGTKNGIAVVHSGSKVEIHFGTDLPRIEGAHYIEEEVTSRYLCEYHTGILEDLAGSGADWVRVISVQRPPDDQLKVVDGQLERLPESIDQSSLVGTVELDPAEAEELGAVLNATANQMRSKAEPAPESQDVAAGAPSERILARDLADAVELGDHLGAIPALSGTFAHVATERGVRVGLPGAESLGFIVPNFSALPWEAVAQFRDHAGAREARERLHEFEADATARERDQSPEFVRSTARAVADGLMGAVKDLAPDLPDDLATPVASTAIGLVPIIGQYASLAISMGDMISALREYERFEGSWIAAVFELRDAAADATIDW
jgi:hypothetical protein